MQKKVKAAVPKKGVETFGGASGSKSPTLMGLPVFRSESFRSTSRKDGGILPDDEGHDSIEEDEDDDDDEQDATSRTAAREERRRLREEKKARKTQREIGSVLNSLSGRVLDIVAANTSAAGENVEGLGVGEEELENVDEGDHQDPEEENETPTMPTITEKILMAMTKTLGQLTSSMATIERIVGSHSREINRLREGREILLAKKGTKDSYEDSSDTEASEAAGEASDEESSQEARKGKKKSKKMTKTFEISELCRPLEFEDDQDNEMGHSPRTKETGEERKQRQRIVQETRAIFLNPSLDGLTADYLCNLINKGESMAGGRTGVISLMPDESMWIMRASGKQAKKDTNRKALLPIHAKHLVSSPHYVTGSDSQGPGLNCFPVSIDQREEYFSELQASSSRLVANAAHELTAATTIPKRRIELGHMVDTQKKIQQQVKMYADQTRPFLASLGFEAGKDHTHPKAVIMYERIARWEYFRTQRKLWAEFFPNAAFPRHSEGITSLVSNWRSELVEVIEAVKIKTFSISDLFVAGLTIGIDCSGCGERGFPWCTKCDSSGIMVGGKSHESKEDTAARDEAKQKAVDEFSKTGTPSKQEIIDFKNQWIKDHPKDPKAKTPQRMTVEYYMAHQSVAPRRMVTKALIV